MVNMLPDERRAFSAMKTQKSERQTFKSVQNTVLFACKLLLKKVECQSVRFGLHADLLKDDRADTLNGVFNNIRIVGMFLIKDYNILVMLSSDLGVSADWLSGVGERLVMLSFLRYVEMLRIMYFLFEATGLNR